MGQSLSSMRHSLGVVLLAVPALATCLPAQAAAPCPRAGACIDVTTFGAVVADFRTSLVGNGVHVITTTVRFTNRTDRPLILGYVAESGVSIDDQGNRYVVGGPSSVRGIGEIRGNNADAKFVLRPGETSDARFEFSFQPSSSRQILGTMYDLDLAVRQVEPLAGGQLRLGREHALHFRGFGNAGAISTASTAAPASALSATGNVAAGRAPEADQCAGRERCYSAGPFVAEVSQFASSTEGNKRYHVLRSTLRFRNVSAQPLILAYKATSDGVTDNLGNRYYWGRPGTYDMSPSGIGKVEGSKADPQFILAPGESREARFTLIRYDANGHELGTSFTQELSVVTLEPLPSGQIRVGREYAIGFKDLREGATDNARATGSAAAGEVTKKLTDLLRGRGRKP